MKNIVGAIALSLISTTLSAQQVVVGVGHSDFNFDLALDAAVFEIEYQHTPFHDTDHWDVSWGVALSVDSENDVFLGAGLVGIYDFDNPWFAEVSLMPGFYSESDPLNNLGNALEFRSLFGVGYEFGNGNAMSLAFQHKSNASTGSTNPGVNTVLLRYHARF